MVLDPFFPAIRKWAVRVAYIYCVVVQRRVGHLERAFWLDLLKKESLYQRHMIVSASMVLTILSELVEAVPLV